MAGYILPPVSAHFYGGSGTEVTQCVIPHYFRCVPIILLSKKGRHAVPPLFASQKRRFADRRFRRAAKVRLYLPFPWHRPCNAQCAQLQPQEDFPFFFWLIR